MKKYLLILTLISLLIFPAAYIAGTGRQQNLSASSMILTQAITKRWEENLQIPPPPGRIIEIFSGIPQGAAELAFPVPTAITHALDTSTLAQVISSCRSSEAPQLFARTNNNSWNHRDLIPVTKDTRVSDLPMITIEKKIDGKKVVFTTVQIIKTLTVALKCITPAQVPATSNNQ